MKKRIIAAILILTMMFGISADIIPASQAVAATKTLDVTTAVRTALANSVDYEEAQNEVILKQAELETSLEKLRLKEKRQSTFSWSPLLNFKLPEDPDLTDEYDYKYKPVEYQSEVKSLEHKRDTIIYQVYEETELLFVTCYQLQEEISYNEKRLKSAKTSLAKNKAKLLIGKATQTDIDTIEKKISTVESSIASDKRNLEANKSKLSDAMGIDLSTGYKFSSPFVSAEIGRDKIDEIVEYTLNTCHDYYTAQVTTENAKMELEANYNLMRNQYGNNMNLIDPFINTAKAGGKVKKAAFKLAYKELIRVVDEPWQGYYWIIFFKIPKEWFKGDIDGVRYIEDDPYALYTSAIEYNNALKEQENTKNEITQNIKDSYENFVSAKNSVETTEKSIASKKIELEKAKALNEAGKMTFDEYNTVQEDYEELQLDLISAKADLSTILYSFNATTCNKISTYFTGQNIDLSVAAGGNSYVVTDEADGIYYNITQFANESVFEVSLTISDDYETDIDSFELWIDGVQIGSRTNIGETIRHLTLDTDEYEKVIIRLYSGDTFVDDCEIDPNVYCDRLSITNYHVMTNTEVAVASYTAETTTSGLVKIKVTPIEGEAISSFTIKDSNGKYLISSDKTSVSKSFTYLGAAKNSLSELTIQLYDSAGEQLYDGYFNTNDNMIYNSGQ